MKHKSGDNLVSTGKYHAHVEHGYLYRVLEDDIETTIFRSSIDISNSAGKAIPGFTIQDAWNLGFTICIGDDGWSAWLDEKHNNDPRITAIQEQQIPNNLCAICGLPSHKSNTTIEKRLDEHGRWIPRYVHVSCK